MEQIKKPNALIIALIVIVLIGVGTTAVVLSRQPEETAVTETVQTEPATTEPEAQTETPATTTTEAATYKDGTYTETGRYVSPGGAESIGVTVTIANDIITSATVTGNATRGESEEHQGDFIAAFKTLVVGKDIDAVSLSRVAGASLTSNGFNAALKLIKADAQA